MRRRFGRRIRARSFGKRFKRYARRGGIGRSTSPIQLDAMIYGGVRNYAANLISPLTGMIPLGSVSDEVALGFVDYMVAKNTSGMVRDVAIKGLIVENARIGEAIVQGGVGGMFGGGGSTTSTVYG